MSAVFALAAVLAVTASEQASMTLYKLPSSVTAAYGAACLDGSPPAFYHRAGRSNRFIIFLEGGGWCSNSSTPGSLADDFEPCDKRALTDTGSSTHYNHSEFGGDYGQKLHIVFCCEV